MGVKGSKQTHKNWKQTHPQGEANRQYNILPTYCDLSDGYITPTASNYLTTTPVVGVYDESEYQSESDDTINEHNQWSPQSAVEIWECPKSPTLYVGCGNQRTFGNNGNGTYETLSLDSSEVVSESERSDDSGYNKVKKPFCPIHHRQLGTVSVSGRVCDSKCIDFYFNDYVAYMTAVLEPLICEQVMAHEVVRHLDFIDKHQFRHDDIPTEAMARLLTCIRGSQTPGKWSAFLNALKHTENDLTYNLLTGQIEKDYVLERKVLQLFAEELKKNLQLNGLLDLLYQKRVINEADKEKIEAVKERHGELEAIGVLLDKVPNRFVEWAKFFVDALRKSGNSHVAKTIADLILDDGFASPCPSDEELPKRLGARPTIPLPDIPHSSPRPPRPHNPPWRESRPTHPLESEPYTVEDRFSKDVKRYIYVMQRIQTLEDELKDLQTESEELARRHNLSTEKVDRYFTLHVAGNESIYFDSNTDDYTIHESEQGDRYVNRYVWSSVSDLSGDESPYMSL